MIPSRRQYARWSLPNKWSFWAAVIGIPIGTVSLVLTLWPLGGSSHIAADRSRNLFLAAQELRHNDEWLTNLSLSMRTHDGQLPPGAIKTDGLLTLVQTEHDWLLRGAYGEEKYIYQHVLLLRDLSTHFGSPTSKDALTRIVKSLDYTLDDIHFLNNFLFWYIKPHMVDSLSTTQAYALGWNGFPGDKFEVVGVPKLNMKHFVHDGRQVTEYLVYLGLID